MKKIVGFLLIISILLNVVLFIVVFQQDNNSNNQYLKVLDNTFGNWQFYARSVSLENYDSYQGPLARITGIWTYHLPSTTNEQQVILQKINDDLSIELKNKEDRKIQIALDKKALELSEKYGKDKPMYYEQRVLNEFLEDYMKYRTKIEFDEAIYDHNHE